MIVMDAMMDSEAGGVDRAMLVDRPDAHGGHDRALKRMVCQAAAICADDLDTRRSTYASWMTSY